MIYDYLRLLPFFFFFTSFLVVMKIKRCRRGRCRRRRRHVIFHFLRRHLRYFHCNHVTLITRHILVIRPKLCVGERHGRCDFLFGRSLGETMTTCWIERREVILSFFLFYVWRCNLLRTANDSVPKWWHILSKLVIRRMSGLLTHVFRRRWDVAFRKVKLTFQLV